jgi:hypothetical protein
MGAFGGQIFVDAVQVLIFDGHNKQSFLLALRAPAFWQSDPYVHAQKKGHDLQTALLPFILSSLYAAPHLLASRKSHFLQNG